MSIKYADLIIDNTSTELDQLFTYIVGEDLVDIIRPGMRVIVPFGLGNKIIKGLVVNVKSHYQGQYKLKEIIDVLDDKPIISNDLINLALWMKKEYLATYLDAFQPVLPPGNFKEVRTFVSLLREGKKVYKKEEKKIINYLKKRQVVDLDRLKRELKIRQINKYLNNLENKGIISTSIDIKTTVQKKKEKWVKLLDKCITLEELDEIIGKRAYKQREIAKYLLTTKEVSVQDLLEKLNTSLNTLRALEEKGVIHIFEKEVHREPIRRKIPVYKKHKLSKKQQYILDEIVTCIHKENRRNFLIHGVTGSGKTEVYLQLVEKMLEENKDSIILVPEIALTPQTIDRFVGRFGKEVAILHSRLSYGERFDQWRKIKEGQVKIVVGARSAIFAPFQNLGLIIIDEEHESTYKSSQNPKYDTIEVAYKRAEIESAALVLGTATPSLETYYKAQLGKFALLELPGRINKTQLPQVQLVDMRDELAGGNKSIFSLAMYKEIKENLDRKKQTILFLNRRGYSAFVSCRECGYVAKCDSCDISMTYYKGINRLRCHYCGLTTNIPQVCPSCGSRYIKHFGIGTEQVEEITKKYFPNARVARMDSDTTSHRDIYEQIFADMKQEKIDILIGTQMISKGLDFKNVTLVGIIAADTILNLPDFTAPERTFQLITQVAGRSGRGKHPGKVILQTYDPDHYSIRFAKKQDYINFYEIEASLRKEFLYPPFINLIRILLYGEDQDKVGKISKKIYNIIGNRIYEIYNNNYGNYINGPNPAPLEKIKNNYRWQVIVKVEDKYLDTMKELIEKVCIKNEYKIDMGGIKLSIDINPNSIL